MKSASKYKPVSLSNSHAITIAVVPTLFIIFIPFWDLVSTFNNRGSRLIIPRAPRKHDC